mgnify:CR=1 FL=1
MAEIKDSKIKRIHNILITALIISLTFVSCAKKNAVSDEKLIRVGVCAGPYGDMFVEAVKPALEEKGYRVSVTEFSDYVQPNVALAENEIDVNIFQHSTYLLDFSKTHNLPLTYISEIPTAAMGIFSEKYKSFDEAPDNITVAIPNDDTNLARALRVLAQINIVDFEEGTNPAKAVTKNAISSKKITFTEVSAEILPSVLDSTDFAVINGNYALSAGLKLSDAVYNEKLGEGYFNVIAVREADKEKDFSKDIVSIVHSEVFRKIIEDPSKQYSAFGKPNGYYENISAAPSVGDSCCS